MLLRHLTAIASLLISSSAAFSQSVDLNWLQQAGVVCGGGLNVEVQGDIEAAVIKRLRLANIDSTGTFKQSDVEKLLDQFSEEAKEPIYRNYVECVLNIMESASSTSNLPPRDVKLTSPIALAALDTLRRGQRTVLTATDVIAIKDQSQIFTVNSLGFNDRPFVYFTWSNSENGAFANNRYVYQGELIKLAEGCTIVPYKIDHENGQVSIISNC